MNVGVDANDNVKGIGPDRRHALIKGSWLPKMGIICVYIYMCALALRRIKINFTQKSILLRQRKSPGFLSVHNVVLKENAILSVPFSFASNPGLQARLTNSPQRLRKVNKRNVVFLLSLTDSITHGYT